MFTLNTDASGTITYWNSARGFGFITIPSGETFFFHVDNFAKDSQPVLEGIVDFRIVPPMRVGKNPMAINVRYRKGIEAVDLLSGLTIVEGGK